MDTDEMVQRQHDTPPQPNGIIPPDHMFPSVPQPPLPPPLYVGVYGTMSLEQDTAATMQPGLEQTQLPVRKGNAAPKHVTNYGSMDSDETVDTAALPTLRNSGKKRHSGGQ